MFAIIRVGGKQYKVESGQQLLVDRLQSEVGAGVENVEVLLLSGENGTQVGAPVVAGASVEATVVRHQKGKKIRVFKYKAKKNYRRRAGQRAHQTLIKIGAIA